MKSPAVSPCEVDLVLRHIFSIRQEAAEAEPGDPCAISIGIRLSDHQRVSDLTINIEFNYHNHRIITINIDGN